MGQGQVGNATWEKEKRRQEASCRVKSRIFVVFVPKTVVPGENETGGFRERKKRQARRRAGSSVAKGIRQLPSCAESLHRWLQGS